MTELIDVTPDEARKIAQLELEFITPLRDVLIEEHSASYRWLMASLLAINAGGLLAIKDSVSDLSNFGWIPGALFFLGVTFALLVARLGQRSTQKALGPLSNLSAALIATIVSGNYDLERVQNEQSAFQNAIKGSWVSQASGWLSFLMFAAALLAVGVNGDHSISPHAKIAVMSQ